MTLDRFQERVAEWMRSCFPKNIIDSASERNMRFIEEAIELVQARGTSRQQVLDVVDYVFSRSIGEPRQEIGGVMVTLAALANQAIIGIGDAANEELTRIEDPAIMQRILNKQLAKPAAVQGRY